MLLSGLPEKDETGYDKAKRSGAFLNVLKKT